MVRRNPNIRRLYRVKKFRRKNQPFAISIRFKEYLDLMSINIEKWLILLDLLEKQVIQLLELNNIPTKDWANYIAHAKECLKKATRFNFASLLNEILIGIQKWILRYLSKEKLIELADESIEKARRYFMWIGFDNIQLLRNYLVLKSHLLIPPEKSISINLVNFVDVSLKSISLRLSIVMFRLICSLKFPEMIIRKDLKLFVLHTLMQKSEKYRFNQITPINLNVSMYKQ